MVVLRNNNTANAAARRSDQPAPTLYFGQRSNYCAWEGGTPPDIHPIDETTKDAPMTVTALDLFAGAGGWSLACQRLGIDETGVEIMEAARQTRAAAGFKTHEVGDVWQFDFAAARGDYDGLIASPPCQTFSTAGKGAGRKALDDVLNLIDAKAYRSMDLLRESAEALGDERTALVLTPLHAAWEMRPEWMAWEQVPTVLPVWQACAEELRSWGYSVWTGNLQAEQYGVPQTRKRAFLIAHREREVAPPTPTHSRYYSRSPEKLDPGVEKWVSMAEALGWGLVPRPSYTYCGVSAHAKGDAEWGGASVRNALKEARDSGDPSRWVHEMPSTTVVGSVRVTVQEAGALQSYPADFPWQGTKTKQYLQVGNSVPPLLAEAVLRQVL